MRTLLRFLSWRTAGHFPAHVLRQIEARQRDSEILVSAVQAFLVLIFAALYVVSRKTFPPSSPFQPVPWALSAYGGFTLFRLVLALRGHLSRSVLTLSALLDIVVLMVTIWSFHVQYGQPAAFYLKAPTLLYVFIFIALRALSFSAAYVLFTGISAAVGWLVLLIYALLTDGQSMVTHDYIAYMTSSRILLGAEIDKMISIVVVTVVLAVAVRSTGQLLQQSVAEHSAASQLSRFLPPEVVPTIIATDEMLRPGEGRQGEAAVMFTDLRGFTKLSANLDPSELIQLLTEYHRAIVPVVERNNGSIMTFLGDGMMVTFGALRRSETYVADALRTTEQVLDAFEHWRQDRGRRNLPALQIGIGVTFGTVICGAIGDGTRLEFAVIGDPVNRAAKLQNHTKIEHVRALTTSDTYDRAIEQGFGALHPIARRNVQLVAGIVAPMDLVAIN